MKNVVRTRIDDRLIHGQVVTGWVKKTECSRILVVDDQVAKDPFMQRLLKAAAPPKMLVEAKSTADASKWLLEEEEAGERILILVKVPETVEDLQKAGLVFDEVILGGMAAKAGRKKFNKNVSASEEEVACMRRIMEKGTRMVFQLVPDETPVDVAKLV